MQTKIDKDETHTGHIWQSGKSAAELSPSKENMTAVRKEIISRALHFDIKDIRTYSGYKGDLLVQITSNDLMVLEALKKQAEILKMQAVIRVDHAMLVHQLYCITPDDVYRLKPSA